ncbi:hypothetical protein DTO195F2_3783 [Paecilomyces variotii]|nr:hypothetical protein DTO195F2_3783 [Paecilomyces variotii]
MYQLEKLTDPGERLPLTFCYDYLSLLSPPMVPSTWDFENPCKDWEKSLEYQKNSFVLHPQAANLPYHSGLPARANRFLGSVIEYSEILLRTFAEDEDLQNVRLLNEMSLADVACRQLQKPPMERFIVPATQLFPYANQERLKLIAASTLLIVLLDDAQQEIKTDMLEHALEDFSKRLANRPVENSSRSSRFQNFIDEFTRDVLSADAITDTGGHDVIETMCKWITHEQYKEQFGSVTEYMEYRWHDSAFLWTCACVKFSIASNVDLSDPKLATFMREAGNHLSLVNDLASFEKEVRDCKSGKASSVINVVDVLQRENKIDALEAKRRAFSMQLESESLIKEELERLKSQRSLSLEQWLFVDAVIAMLGGNVFFCMTTSRYGGESSRIGGYD